jgi:hypothetical protein
MNRVFASSLLALFLAAGASLAADSHLAPLARLEGHCWQGEFAEGGSWDKHCFAWAYDGQFLRDTHVVTGKRGPYGGETLYRFDAAKQRIVYHYFDATGGYSEGAVEPTDGELRFPEERYQEGANVRVLRTIWRIEGDDRYSSVTEEQRDGRWVEAWRVVYAKQASH